MFYVIKRLVDNMGKREELPKRKKNRIENYDYGSCGAYFVTICTVKRQNYFWKSDAVIETTNDYENVGATIVSRVT